MVDRILVVNSLLLALTSHLRMMKKDSRANLLDCRNVIIREDRLVTKVEESLIMT